VFRALSRSLLPLLLALAACTGSERPLTSPQERTATSVREEVVVPLSPAPAIGALVARANAALEEAQSPYRVAEAQWLTPQAMGENQILAFDHGNRRLPFQFVCDDPRRIGDGPGRAITYLVDRSDGSTGSGLSASDTEAAIDRAMETWGDLPGRLQVRKVEDDGSDPDFLDGIFGFGEVGVPRAQIVHAGWVHGVLPADVLAITFTVAFRDDRGLYTDVDGDGRWDCAFREIYYNDDWAWGIDTGLPRVDVESVALHESGHGLSQGHFGRISLVPSNGGLRISPLAVMNAAYTGPRQDLLGTDRSGHSSLWNSWGR